MYSAHQSARCTLSLLMRSAHMSAHHVKVFDDEYLQQLAEVTRGRDDAVGLLAAGLGAHIRDRADDETRRERAALCRT